MGFFSVNFVNLAGNWVLIYICGQCILYYFDRGAISALIPTLQDSSTLNLSNLEAGSLGSIFMFSYMILSPLFGYLSQNIHPYTII